MRMIIMVGPSGSGKSTFVSALRKELDDERTSSIVCSADDYFIQNGEYKFDASKLGEAHAECFKRAVFATESEYDVIIIDNSNMTNVEFHVMDTCENLDAMAETFAARNVHNVPRATIERQMDKFEAPLAYWGAEVFVHGR